MNIVNQMKDQWQNMSVSDRRALTILGAFGIVMLVVFGIWQPSQKYIQQAQAQHQGQLELLQWMTQKKPLALQAMRSNGGHGSLGGQSILNVIGRSARSTGLELKRFEPEGERGVRVVLETVPFNKLVVWLDGLKKQYGIQVERITINREDHPGLVDARINLSAL